MSEISSFEQHNLADIKLEAIRLIDTLQFTADQKESFLVSIQEADNVEALNNIVLDIKQKLDRKADF